MTDTIAPEIPEGLAWLNAPGGSLHEQRGRIVALAFVNAASAWGNQNAISISRYMSTAVDSSAWASIARSVLL